MFSVKTTVIGTHYGHNAKPCNYAALQITATLLAKSEKLPKQQ